MTSADENRQRKASAIARALWRRGMTVEDLFRLSPASRDRTVPTMRRFARTAYDEAGVQEAEPHGPGSPTWRLTDLLLTRMARFAGDHPDSPDVPARDLTDDRPNWAPEAPSCSTLDPNPSDAPLTPSAAPDAVTTSMTTTTEDAASSPPPDGTSKTPAPVAGPDSTYDFPRAEGASCPCGTWHRRYGPQGGGALCPPCRTLALTQGDGGR